MQRLLGAAALKPAVVEVQLVQALLLLGLYQRGKLHREHDFPVAHRPPTHRDVHQQGGLRSFLRSGCENLPAVHLIINYIRSFLEIKTCLSKESIHIPTINYEISGRVKTGFEVVVD